jgi:hypothetical protein
VGSLAEQLAQKCHYPAGSWVFGNSVIYRLSLTPRADKAFGTQFREMLRQRRLTKSNGTGQIVHGHLNRRHQLAEDQQPLLIGKQQ